MATKPWSKDILEGSTVNVTEHAVAAGWTLPEGWVVQAWLETSWRIADLPHVLHDDPVAMDWYDQGRWQLVTLWVRVVEPAGGNQGRRVWAELPHWDGQQLLIDLALGEVPERDPGTGDITARHVDPIADAHEALLGVINAVLTDARDGLIEHAAKKPTITAP